MSRKTETNVKSSKRLLGRLVARELTAEEIAAVAGGRVVAAYDTCSNCTCDDCGSLQ